MKFKVVVCDDEKEQAESLSEAVRQWGERNSVSLEVCVFPSAEAFLFAYERNQSFDILLLDVEMSGMNGVDLAKRLRKEGDGSEIIFITSHFEFYGEGYEVDALHYLIKPVDPEKLWQVLAKAVQRRMEEPASVVVGCEGETVRIYEREILYVEALLHYVCIHTAAGEYKFKENLSDFAKALSKDFYQTHRSYYVSLKHISRISRRAVTLDDGTQIPLSRGKYDDINRAYIERF